MRAVVVVIISTPATKIATNELDLGARLLCAVAARNSFVELGCGLSFAAGR
jgi:hypothetical protein